MRSCGKRLFTRACKGASAADWRGGTRIKNKSGSAVAGPLFFGFEFNFEEIFSCCGGGAFFQGFCEKRCFGVVILW